MILDYIEPTRIYKRLAKHVEELTKYSKFKKIIAELNSQGKLDEIGLKVDSNSNMYIGIDLNPELLLYSETSQESVELKLVAEKMNRYNDFLTKEGILDAIKVDYERIQTDAFYGYILQIGFKFNEYRRSDLIYGSVYFSALFIALALSILVIL
jgi:hypothetical protein